ncbi:MAG: hypothetical protein WCT49_05305 [Candidatus Paceibacterota bacterium]
MKKIKLSLSKLSSKKNSHKKMSYSNIPDPSNRDTPVEKTSEKEFQNRLRKKVERMRKNRTELSWEESAKKFLDSDSLSSQATKVALGLVVACGVLTAFSIMPGLTVAAAQYKRARYYSKKQLRDAGENLKRRGYVEITQKGGRPRIRLTKKGKEYFQKMIFEEARLSSQEKWDGKWRFVLFDIPTERNKAREALRWRLRILGFYQYQKSVWVYPYPCKDEILFVADHFGVGKFVEVLEATGLSDDTALKKYFELP